VIRDVDVVADDRFRKRTPPKGLPATDQDQPSILDRDRPKTDSAGRVVSPRRARSKADSWDDEITPPTSDPGIWHAVQDLGRDVEKLDEKLDHAVGDIKDELGEMKGELGKVSGQLAVTTDVLKQVLVADAKEKELVLTSQVKVQERGALSVIEDRSEQRALWRRVTWKWLGGTLAAAFMLIVGAIVQKCTGAGG
jgi:hypothetical protein